MQKEDQIIGMLGQIAGRLDKIENRLDKIEHRLDNVETRLGNVEHRLDGHDTKLDDHNQMLRGLLAGQETLLQQLEEIKISNAKEFGELKDEAFNQAAQLTMLRDDVWANRTEIYRMKRGADPQ
ncbi:hypothetical protein [Oceanobacillus kapialis]|uniref:Uncharacterized protein n=1 Tax=Oceanobacillus kapialis TaxID=481353 RepID=A0ABW5PWW3_9BACI